MYEKVYENRYFSMRTTQPHAQRGSLRAVHIANRMQRYFLAKKNKNKMVELDDEVFYNLNEEVVLLYDSDQEREV